MCFEPLAGSQGIGSLTKVDVLIGISPVDENDGYEGSLQ